MGTADLVVLLAGIASIAFAFTDIFQAVIVPRAPTLSYRISFIVWRSLWKVWPAIGKRLYPHDAARREEFFATFAPLALIVMLITWVLVLVLGYGAVMWGLRGELAPVPRSYFDAAYFAGTSFLTIGFGDIVARQGFARFVSLCAAASGLGVVSITTAYLFALFGTFQRRESFIVTFAARAGSPPSAVGLYEIAAMTHTRSSLCDLMREAQGWTAALMESHLAYPVLAFFRSSHDDQSWVGTLGALLDASLLADTMLDPEEYGEARICFSIARHAVRDLATFFRIGEMVTGDPGIARADFDRACKRLVAAGYALCERDEAWERFARTRGEYAGPLNAMARFFKIPQVAWIGDGAASHAHDGPGNA
ncbi:MAG: potassium channel family protein [Candidatus Tyrphobacter sp.]